MMYSQTQVTPAWVGLTVYGFFSLIAIICFNIIPPIFQQYWGYGAAGAFWWYAPKIKTNSLSVSVVPHSRSEFQLSATCRSVGFLFTAKYYKSLVIEESNNKQSLRIYFPVVNSMNPGCMNQLSLDRGILITFDNIEYYKVHEVNPFSGCTQQTGSFIDGCCWGDYHPVGFSINESDRCCSNRWKEGQNMIEFQLKEALTYNECGCNCTERHVNIIRVGTEDLNGLLELLHSRNVKQYDSVLPVLDKSVQLQVNP